MNALLLRTDGGALLVDHEGDWQTLEADTAVVAAVRAAMADEGVDGLTYLVNTHWHGDHSAGNPHYPEATVVAHANVRLRLAERQTPWWFPDGIGPMPAEGWPDLVFDTALTLTLGDERVHLWHFGPAHSDGDAVVYLESARVVHMGDLYHGLTTPSVGEDMDGLARTLAAAATRVHPETRVVTGHGGVTSVEELDRYRQMLSATLDAVRRRIAEGATLDDLLAAPLPEPWSGTLDPETRGWWVTEIHRSLTAAPP